MSRELTLAKRTLVSVIQGLEGEITTIDMRDETSVKGRITAVDGFMNFEMADVIYTAPSGAQSHWERFCGQGKFIRFVEIPSDIDPIKTIKNRLEDIKIQAERRGKGGRGGRRGGRGGGRRGGGRFGGRGGSSSGNHRSSTSGGFRTSEDPYRSSDRYRSSGGNDRYSSSDRYGDRYRSGGSSYEGSSYSDYRGYGGGSSSSYGRSRY